MDPIIPALILSKAIEFGITERSIRNGMIEGNYLQSDRSSRIVLNSAFLVGSPILYKEIKKKNKKLAKVTGIVLVLGNSYLIYHNVRLMKK
jgi:hypothetical protein